jgi:tetratricopeptide (TPR) repeat protein
LEQEQKWPEALAAAKRAEMVLATGAATTADLDARVKQAVAELTLLSAIDEARMISTETADSKFKIADSSFNYVGADRAYRQAFAEMGLPIEERTVEQAAARLGNSSPMATPLAAGLTDWALTQRKVRDNPDEPSALHLLAVADAIDPDPWRSQLRAILKEQKGTRGKAFQELATSAPIQQLPPSTLVALAVGLRDEVSAEAAVELLRPAQDQHPSDFWISFRLAYSLGELQPPLPEEQREFYRVALAIRPKSSAVRNNLGVTLTSQGKVGEAIEYYRTAIEVDPKYALFHNNLGNALKSQGKLDEAIECYRTAIEVDPTAGYHLYKVALVASGRLTQYREFCAALLERQGQTDDPKIARSLTQPLLIGPDAVDDWSLPLRLSQLVLISGSGKHGVISHVSELLCRAGMHERSLEMRAEAIAKAGREPHAWDCFWQAMAHQGLGNIDQARELASKARELADSGVLSEYSHEVFEVLFTELTAKLNESAEPPSKEDATEIATQQQP